MQSYTLIPSMYAIQGSISEVFASPTKITAKEHSGQKSDGTYTSGNITQYAEEDFINFQFVLEATHGPSNGQVEVRFTGDDGTCLFFDNYFSLVGVSAISGGPVPAVSILSGPTATDFGTSNGEWVVELDVDYTGTFSHPTGSALVEYTLQLSEEAGGCNGSSQHSRLNASGGVLEQSGQQNVPVPANQVIELPDLTIIKDVVNGTANPNQWCFNVSPSINGKSSYCIIGDGDGVDRVVIQNIDLIADTPTNFTVTEVSIPGYGFDSGSGTNCTFDGSIATATVTAANTAVDATCQFNNTPSPSGLVVYKDVQGPNGEDIVDVSELFTVTLDGADGQTLTDGGSVNYTDLAADTYTVNETNMPSGYTAYAVTDMEGNLLDSDLSDGAEILVGEAQTREIIIVNRQSEGTLTINKNVVAPDGITEVVDNTTFTVDLSGTEVISNEPISENSPAVLSLNPGTYTINEDSNSNYDQTNASQCNSYEFTITPGGSTSLTCVNAQKNATVNVYKDVRDYDNSNIVDNTEFTVNLDGVNSTVYEGTGTIQDTSLDLSLQTPETFTVVPGDYLLTEDAEFGFDNMGCKISTTGSLDTTLDLTLGSNQSVDIYCVNKVQVGDIVVTKVLTTPDGLFEVTNDDTNFTVVLDGNMGTAQVVQGGEFVTFFNVRVGNHTITEIVPSDYNFVGFSTDLDVNTSGAQLVVVKDTSTNLTITNSQDWARIYVDKEVMAPDGVTDVSDDTHFNVEIKDFDLNVIVALGTKEIYEGMTANSAYYDVYPGYTYYINELENPLYTSVNCNNLSTGELSSGSEVSITCVNDQKLAMMTIFKLMLNPDGSVVYDSTEFTVNILFEGQTVESGLIAALESQTGLVVDGLVPGTYTVEEVGNENYASLGCVESEVTLTSGSTETIVTCTNQQMVGSITVSKDVINPDGGEVADATTFDVTLTANLETTEGTYAYESTKTISELSDATFEDLNPGTYYLTETPNDDYERMNCDNLEIVVESNDHENSVTCINKQKVASFDIEKNVLGPNGVGDVVDNEEFTVTVYDSATNDPVVGYEGITISEENPYLNVVVNPGSYYVQETNNPDYTEMGCGIGVTLSSNDTTGNVVTCTNWQNDATVTVYKDVINYDDQDINDNTEFTVNLDGVDDTTDSDSGVISDDEDLPKVAVLSVVPGDYDLTEVSEYGYENMGCRVGREGELAAELELNDLTSGDSVTVYCVNRVQVGSIQVYKQLVDVNGELVAGDTTEFQFELNGSNTETVTPGNYVEYINLLPGQYDVTELENSDYQIYGYEGDEEAGEDGVQVTVVPNQTTVATIVNQQLPAILTVEKDLFREVEEGVEEVISSVEFETEVRDSEGQVVSAVEDSPYISDNGDDSKVAVYYLNPGSYNLTELEKDGFIFHGCNIKEEEKILDVVNDFNVEVGSNEPVTYECRNEVVNPELKITKFNDKSGVDLLAGDAVTYTLVVTAPPATEEAVIPTDVEVASTDSPYLLSNVVVTDLMPEGFSYESGTWTAKKNGVSIPVPQPSYGSLGTWLVGDMEEGDEVVLTYLANISTSQDAGTYEDLAWVKGDDVVSDPVIGDGEVGFFADSNVRVVNDIEEGNAEVLGVSLPNTGAETLLTILGIISLLVGLILFAVGPHKRRLEKGVLASFVILAGVFSLMNPMQANAADSLAVRVEQPKTVFNKTSMKLGFVALDIEGRDVTADCQVMKPGEGSFSNFGSTFDLGAGGDSADCVVDSSVLSTEGTYEFRVVANAGADTTTSSEVSMLLDLTGPELVKNYEKTKGTCTYTLTFTTANDGETSKVQVFRSTEKSFVANSSTLVTVISATPNQEVTYTDTVPNCDLEYFYAVRAVDDADNSSDFTADTVVTVVPGTIIDEGGEVQGAGTGNNNNGGNEEENGGNGSDNGDNEEEDVKGTGDKESTNGDSNKKDENTVWDWLKYVLLAVALLGAGGVAYLYVRNRNNKPTIK